MQITRPRTEKRVEYNIKYRESTPYRVYPIFGSSGQWSSSGGCAAAGCRVTHCFGTHAHASCSKSKVWHAHNHKIKQLKDSSVQQNTHEQGIPKTDLKFLRSYCLRMGSSERISSASFASSNFLLILGYSHHLQPKRTKLKKTFVACWRVPSLATKQIDTCLQVRQCVHFCRDATSQPVEGVWGVLHQCLHISEYAQVCIMIRMHAKSYAYTLPSCA